MFGKRDKIKPLEKKVEVGGAFGLLQSMIELRNIHRDKKWAKEKERKEKIWEETLRHAKPPLTEQEQKKLSKIMRKKMIGAEIMDLKDAGLMDWFKDFVSKEARVDAGLREQGMKKIETPEDERLFRKAFVFNAQHGWDTVKTYNALKESRFTEKEKKKIYNFALRYKVPFGTSMLLEINPELKKTAMEAVKKYHLPLNGVIAAYLRFAATKEFFNKTFETCAKTGADPALVIESYIKTEGEKEYIKRSK